MSPDYIRGQLDAFNRAVEIIEDDNTADFVATIRAEAAKLPEAEGIDWKARGEKAEYEAKGRAYHMDQCEQIAGKALGYPWFKNEQKNFPGSTEEDGVCIGEHFCDSIVEELANKFKATESALAAMTEKYQKLVAWADDQLGTPCEHIRHQQEVEDLRVALAAMTERVRVLEEALRPFATMNHQTLLVDNFRRAAAVLTEKGAPNG